MITKTDCMSILVRLENQGINIDEYIKKLVISKEVPLDVLQFISKHQGIEVSISMKCYVKVITKKNHLYILIY